MAFADHYKRPFDRRRFDFAADYFAGRDPVMDATIELIAGDSGR